MFSPLQKSSRIDTLAANQGAREDDTAAYDVPATNGAETSPLEPRDIPPQLSRTLEHIVGQLDVLTQVVNLTIVPNIFSK